jgi:hypothetical protein
MICGGERRGLRIFALQEKGLARACEEGREKERGERGRERETE